MFKVSGRYSQGISRAPFSPGARVGRIHFLMAVRPRPSASRACPSTLAVHNVAVPSSGPEGECLSSGSTQSLLRICISCKSGPPIITFFWISSKSAAWDLNYICRIPSSFFYDVTKSRMLACHSHRCCSPSRGGGYWGMYSRGGNLGTLPTSCSRLLGPAGTNCPYPPSSYKALILV